MKKISTQLRQILQQELGLLKTYGVDHVGYRYFLKDGRSFGLPTCENWYKNVKDDIFYRAMKNFLTEELLKLSVQNHHIVSRSDDHDHSEYLQTLGEMKMNNSIGLYIFNKERIDSFFYIYNNNIGQKRDLIINNLHIIEAQTKKIFQKVQGLTEHILFHDEYEFSLDATAINQLFDFSGMKTRYPKHTKILINGKDVCLTNNEIRILKVLKNSLFNSNKTLAEKLSLSLSTTEKHLSKLKAKLNIFTKNDLLTFVWSSQCLAILERI